MRKKLIIGLVIIAIIIATLLYFSSRTFIESPSCFYGGGTWKMFSNGCGDSCSYERQTSENPIFCTQAFEESCDCGPNECWDYGSKKCVKN